MNIKKFDYNNLPEDGYYWIYGEYYDPEDGDKDLFTSLVYFTNREDDFDIENVNEYLGDMYYEDYVILYYSEFEIPEFSILDFLRMGE